MLLAKKNIFLGFKGTTQIWNHLIAICLPTSHCWLLTLHYKGLCGCSATHACDVTEAHRVSNQLTPCLQQVIRGIKRKSHAATGQAKIRMPFILASYHAKDATLTLSLIP